MGNFLDNRLNNYSNEEFLSLPDSLRNDKTFVLNCLKRNGLLFKHLSSQLKCDIELKLEAIKQNEEVIKFLDIKDFEDINFVLNCLQMNSDVFPLLPLTLRSRENVLLWAIPIWGVDAFWELPSDVFKNIHLMLMAMKSPGGNDEDLWSAVLNGVGGEAYFHKILIEQAHKKYGDLILEKDLNWIKSQAELKEVVEGLLPEERWMSYFG